MKKWIMFSTPIVLMALSGCGDRERPVEAAAAAAVEVHAVTVQTQSWPTAYEAVGTIRARTSAVVASKVMGYVRQVRVQAGDTVRAGQPLIILDAQDLDAGYRQAEAARQEVRSTTIEVEQAVASANASLDLAKATYQRLSGLYQSKSISDQEYDEASARLKVAQAAFDMAASRRAQLAARLEQAEQGVRTAGITRSYAEITAPFAGTVTEKHVDQGNLATPGAPLLTIEQAGAFRLEVPVEEALLPQIRVGQSVEVTFDFVNGSVKGTVAEIVPSVDPVSRSFVVKVGLPALPNLRSGVFGRAQFQQAAQTALVIPAEAVSEYGQVESVLTVENGHARSRLITTGRKSDGRMEVLSGLRAGDRVIYPRSAALSDGARVEVRP